MNTELKLKLEKAIEKVLIKECEDSAWEGYIHDELFSQMANAAEQVFDSAMSAQEFAQEQV